MKVVTFQLTTYFMTAQDCQLTGIERVTPAFELRPLIAQWVKLDYLFET